ADWHAQGDPLASAARSAEAEALDRLADSEILRALRDLPEEFRMAVYLADIEGYAYKEIAEIMGTPIGTVMSRLHRGRGRLRDKLAAYAPGQAVPGFTGYLGFIAAAACGTGPASVLSAAPAPRAPSRAPLGRRRARRRSGATARTRSAPTPAATPRPARPPAALRAAAAPARGRSTRRSAPRGAPGRRTRRSRR